MSDRGSTQGSVQFTGSVGLASEPVRSVGIAGMTLSATMTAFRLPSA